MDWGTFFDKYSESLLALGGVCIGVVASFIGLIMGYFFQKWSDKRKRTWELDDRVSNRRLELKNRRVEEARVYLETYFEAIQALTNFAVAINNHKIGKPYKTDLDKITELINSATKKSFSIPSLGDSELYNLNLELVKLFSQEHHKVLDRIANNSILDKRKLEENLLEFSRRIGSIIGKM